MILSHIIALTLGVILDLIVGDPHGIPHPVVYMGHFIAFMEKKLLGDGGKKNFKSVILRGGIMVLTVTAISGLLVFIILFVSYRIHRILGICVESILTCYALAAKCLYKESMKVYRDLEKEDIKRARNNLSMIVGRDTHTLDQKHIVMATVETVAENTSDGVIAPLFYLFIGGPILGLMYKAVNTMDSMVGYRNERYEYFGKVAAKTDDAVNFIPARLSAIFMIGASFVAGLFDGKIRGKESFLIWRRDRLKHKSPNSAQTESVCAGALGIMLGGDSTYKGVLVSKPTLGDDIREVWRRDIFRANLLMFVTEILAFVVFVIILLAIAAII